MLCHMLCLFPMQDLKDQFREVGVVVYANVVKDDTGRSKGWGIVEFETPEEVRPAELPCVS